MEKKKMKSRGCLVTIIFLLLLFLLWFNYVSIKGEKEDHFRTFVMVNLRDKVEAYHGQHTVYPKTLLDLDLQNKEYVAGAIRSGVFIYTRDPSGKEWYRLICRFSGAMKIGEGKYSVSWKGLQYSNNKEQLDIMPGDHSQPDKNGFYMVDLH